MKHRNRPEDALGTLGPQGEPGGGLQRIRDQIAVGEHRSLRGAGRAPRVLEDGDVVGIRRHIRRIGRSPREARKAMDPWLPRNRQGPVTRFPEVLPPFDRIELTEGRPEKFRGVTKDDPLEGRRGLRLHDVRPEDIQGDDRLDAGVGPQGREFARRVEWIRLNDDGADPEDREERDDEMRGVREKEGHVVPGSNTDRPQARGEAIHGRVDLAVCQRLPVERDRGPLSMLAGSPSEQFLNRDVRVRQGPRQVAWP